MSLIERKQSEKYLVSPKRLLDRSEKLHYEFHTVDTYKGLVNRVRPGPRNIDQSGPDPGPGPKTFGPDGL